MVKRTTYLGGEEDKLEKVTPRIYEDFFNRRALFVALAMLVIFAITVLIWPL